MSQWRTLVFGVLLVSAVGASACYKDEKNLMLWDMAHYCISKARDIYSNVSKDPKERKRERSRPYMEKAKQLILELEESYLPDEPLVDHSVVSDSVNCDQKPIDCSDVLKAGHTENGVYTICPGGKALDSYCDMNTDGGGWTVIQRRGNVPNQEDFYRGWNDYKDGFGNVTRDFWLGNENIYLIANQSQYQIRFDLADAEGDRRFAVYRTFWLDDEKGKYTLHIGNYSGDAGDSMAYHNGHVFSTKDSETPKCANERKAGWWYDYCTESNLNGLYQPGVEDKEGITWYSWHNQISLAGSEIKLRRN